MPNLELRTWRSHPILVAAALGAVIGAGNAAAIEIGGVLHKNSSAVLPLLLPDRTGVTEPGVMQTAFLLFVQFGVNILVFTLLFALPVAVIVAIRRAFQTRSRQ